MKTTRCLSSEAWLTGHLPQVPERHGGLHFSLEGLRGAAMNTMPEPGPRDKQKLVVSENQQREDCFGSLLTWLPPVGALGY